MVTLSQTEQDIYKQARAYLLGLFPGAARQIVQALPKNNQPLPKDAVVMFVALHRPLDQPVMNYDPANEKTGIQTSVEVTLQLDFYGESAASRCRIVDTIWKSQVTCGLVSEFQPLYVKSSRPLPYINESNQYEERWVLELALQYNPQVVVDQDFTDSASITIIPVL